MKLSKETILIVLAFFAIYVIWGSTYLLNKIAVQEIPPLFLTMPDREHKISMS